MSLEDNTHRTRSKVILSQVLACLALDFLLIGLGLSISFVTMVLPAVLDAPEGISVTKEQASWLGSIAFLCQPLGSIFSGPLLDYFGRKRALFLVNIPHVIAWLIMYYSWDIPSLFLGNALLGIGTGIMEAPSITYVGEISDPSVRGILTTLTNSFTALGLMLAYILGTVLPWREAALAALVIPLTTMVIVTFVPETPIWLLSKGRKNEALISLCRLRGWAKPDEVKEEFDELVSYSEVTQQCVICIKKGQSQIRPCEHDKKNYFQKLALKIKYVFLVKETLRPFMLVTAYFFFHTMSGLGPVKSNMVNLCGALGMQYDPKAIVVFVGVVFLALNLVSAVSVKLFGKRKLVLGSLFLTACSSFALSIYASVRLPPTVFSYDTATFPQQKEMLPVVLFIALVCFSCVGIPWVLLSEVFPFRTRGVATSLAAAVAYFIYFFGSKTNYNIEASFHLSGTFGFYAAIGFVGTIYLYFFLPETESKSLMEIETFYNGKTRIFADDFLIKAFKKKLNGDVRENTRLN